MYKLTGPMPVLTVIGPVCFRVSVLNYIWFEHTHSILIQKLLYRVFAYLK